MKPKIINNVKFNVDSDKCPQELKLVLREQIRDVFSRRSYLSSCTLSNAGIDAVLEEWWKHHKNIIRAASIRPEWNWSTLCLYFDENIARSSNLYKTEKDFLTLLARPCGEQSFRSWCYSVGFLPYIHFDLGPFHSSLYSLFAYVFRMVILEGKYVSEDSTFVDADGVLSANIVTEVKDFITSHSERDIRGAFCTAGIANLLSEEGIDFIPFNKLPEKIFKKRYNELSNGNIESFDNSLREYFDNHSEDFISDLFKSIGAHQMCGDKGPVKTTLTNKLVKSFYEWLTALSVGSGGNPHFDSRNDFSYYLDYLKRFTFYSEEAIKQRDAEHGFTLSNYGTFEQIFARMQESVKGTVSKESFIVSFHPCDMLTCSLGHSWSSCQSWVTNFADLNADYGYLRNTYNGCYSGGNMQFLCGNCFVVYIPHTEVENLPQYYWPKKTRCLIWVGDNLDCMRQNYFYPGKPNDETSKSLAKAIREYIQDVVAPFNFSNGTSDWVCKRNTDSYGSTFVEDFIPECKVKEIYSSRSSSCRYDDPIAAVSYLKGENITSFVYAVDFPKLDTGIPNGIYESCSSTYGARRSFFTYNGNKICPICGKSVTKKGICSNCKSEMVIHNGKKIHPSDLVTIQTSSGYEHFDLTELDSLEQYVSIEDGVFANFKSAYKVFMPSGIKYFKTLPSYVKQCKVCNEYFHPSFMIGDVCIEHFNSSLKDGDNKSVADINDVINSFLQESISFDCEDTDSVVSLLRLLDEKKVKWISGINAIDYIPRTDGAKKMYLSINKNRLVLSSQPKCTVINLSNLFKKGGE